MLVASFRQKATIDENQLSLLFYRLCNLLIFYGILGICRNGWWLQTFNKNLHPIRSMIAVNTLRDSSGVLT